MWQPYSKGNITSIVSKEFPQKNPLIFNKKWRHILPHKIHHLLILSHQKANILVKMKTYTWFKVFEKNVDSAHDCLWNTCAFKYITVTLTVLLHNLYRNKQYAWWRHQMETCSALLAISAGNSPVSGEFPAQRPVTRSFDVFFDLRLNNSWVNNREDGDLRRYPAHYDATVMRFWWFLLLKTSKKNIVPYGHVLNLPEIVIIVFDLINVFIIFLYETII